MPAHVLQVTMLGGKGSCAVIDTDFNISIAEQIYKSICCFTRQGLVDMRTRIVRCPECRMEHFVPINGASGFPTNITLINFLDLQAQPGKCMSTPAVCKSVTLFCSEADRQQPFVHYFTVTAASSTSGTGGESSSSGGGTVVGSINQCGVCEKEAETTKCAHCNKFTCESCRKSHFNQMKFDIGRVVNQLRRGVPKLSNRIATVEQKSEQVRLRRQRELGLSASKAPARVLRELNCWFLRKGLFAFLHVFFCCR